MSAIEHGELAVGAGQSVEFLGVLVTDDGHELGVREAIGRRTRKRSPRRPTASSAGGAPRVRSCCAGRWGRGSWQTDEQRRPPAGRARAPVPRGSSQDLCKA